MKVIDRKYSVVFGDDIRFFNSSGSEYIYSVNNQPMFLTLKHDNKRIEVIGKHYPDRDVFVGREDPIREGVGFERISESEKSRIKKEIVQSLNIQ